MADSKSHFLKLKRFFSTCLLCLALIPIGYADSEVTQVSPQIIEKIQSFNPKLREDDAYHIVISAIKWASENQISPALILGIIAKESSFVIKAFGKGSYGLMQIQTVWHKNKLQDAFYLVGSREPMNIDANIYVGARIFKDCESKHRRLERSLKCYNGNTSPRSTYAKEVLVFKKQFDMYI